MNKYIVKRFTRFVYWKLKVIDFNKVKIVRYKRKMFCVYGLEDLIMLKYLYFLKCRLKLLWYFL